ncbi:protein EMBRYONIC FLOWER 1 [Quercus suber]|uniref:protein EMBRYONIC FLOWER 1 n=1 Tax=Quercus suber TaxID=58331 RepID=UPI000CE1CDF6|nr:protein EMBRYONIC FLOWER 1 [Quercus suber]XP_023914133.1 protein EMBRYONIC FLOWER 1 [Quercus suber]XP_023914134.1 protein EMBRYONIC FLOWER 1 [Quercus suber]
MERSIVVEENHCKSNVNTVSKSDGPFIQIDSISIDLVSAKDKSDAGKCEHFSIRGYVAEIHKKDWKRCYPFSLEGDQTESEEQTSFLPPLDVPKFRWWRCQNCLREVASKGAAKDDGTVLNCCSTKCRSNSTCSHVSSLGSAAVLLPGFQQAPKQVLDGRSVDANTSTKLSNDNHLLLCSDKKEKKVELANNTFIGNDIGTEDNVNKEIPKLTSAALEVNSRMIQRSNANEAVAPKSKCNGSIEFYEPGCGSHVVADIELADRNLKCIVNDSAEHCQTGTQTSPVDQHIELTKACQIVGFGSMVDEAPNAVKSHTTGNPSLELDECDYEASENADIMVGDDLPDHHLDKSSGLLRRKIPKVRLLTELLGKNSDAKSDHIETDNPPSNGIPNASGGLDTLSVPQGHVAIQGNVKRAVIQNRKRKLAQDEEWRPPEITSSNNLNKKAQTWKGDAETTDAIVGNESEDAFAEIGLKTDRNPTVGKKKNKKMQDVGADLSLALPQANVQKGIQDKIGNTSKSNAVDTVSFRLAHDAFAGREMDTFPFALRTEKKPKMCKKKNKNPQVDGGEAALFPLTDSMLRNNPFTRKNIDIMQTGSITPFQSVQDSSTEKGLHLSLNSFLDVPRYDTELIRRVEGGQPILSPWQEGTPRVDQVLRKHMEINSLGESSVPSKSPTDAFSGKGVNCEVKSKITTFRIPYLNEHNCTYGVEAGGCSQIQQMGYSGASNISKTSKAQEHSAVDKKHSDKKADKVSEQGTLDDIPMEIVELMAKNQYERCLHDADNKKRQLETTNNTGNGQMMDSANTYGNGELRLQEELTHKRISQARNVRNGVITTDKNVGPPKRKAVDYFSPIDRNHLNVSHLDQFQNPKEFRNFAQSQKNQSSGVQFSATSSSTHSRGQNCKWNGGIVGHGPSHATLQALGGCNTQQQTAPKQTEAAVHLWPPMIPNQIPFGYNLPQKGVAQSTNIDMLSQFPSSLHKGNMKTLKSDHDLKFLNLNAPSLEHNMSFGSETFGRNNAEYPLACKHNGIGLPQNLMGSLDIYSNETIPAMHLLSLMDAGMRSGPTFNMGGTSKFPKRPSFPLDHNSKEFPRIEIGAYKTMDSIKHASSDYCSKNHFSEKSHGCFHCTPTVGASTSFQNDEGFQRATNFTGQVALKTQNKDKRKFSKSPTQSRGRRPENLVFPNASLGTDLGAIPVASVQKRVLGASDSTVFTKQYHGMENSTQHPKRSEICGINQNPADFSKPVPGNRYMIRGEDLKFEKATPQSRHSVCNLVGRKRHRNPKQTTIKERVQH